MTTTSDFTTNDGPATSQSAARAFAAAAHGSAAQALQQRIGLPDTYLDDLEQHVAPLAAALTRRARAANRPLLIGLNGCQGSGKSTVAQFLALMLQDGAGVHCTVMSIDDFYLTREARQRLAQEVHPLLATRGVPGTHDLALANETLDALLDPTRETAVQVPVFDKAIDERAPRSQWPQVPANSPLVVLEGWCVGCPPQDAAALAEPANDLEQQEDPRADWRTYVNQALAGHYRELFARIDYLAMLAAPDFDCVFRWRSQQEQQLKDHLRERGADDESGKALLNSEALRRFVRHFERLTRHQLGVLPGLASGVISLAADHRMTAHTGPLFR